LKAKMLKVQKTQAIVSLGGNVNQQEIRSALIAACEVADPIEDNAFSVIPLVTLSLHTD